LNLSQYDPIDESC